MDRSYIAGLLVKHLIGTLNEEEDRMLKQWLASDERHPQMMKILLDKERLKERWEQYRTFDKRGSWEAIRARVPALSQVEYQEEALPVPAQRSPVRYWAALWFTLVGLCLLVAAAALFWRGGKTRKTDVVMLQYNDAKPIDISACAQGWQLRAGNLLFSKPEAGLVQISVLDPTAPIGRVLVATPKGENFRISLPDSSLIELNTDTRVEMEGSYGKDRQVTIQGEAFFKVRHRDDQSFTVKVGPLLSITATGTVFDIKAYPEESSVRTNLISGLLRIRDTAGRQHILEAHQTLTVDRFGQVKTPPVADTTDDISWVNGQFNYNGTPIREILDDLRHWYRADIEVQGEPKGHFTFSCSRRETLQFVLDRLARTKHLQYKTAENKVIVYFDQP